MNNYDKALKRIECEKLKRPIITYSCIGPTGPAGPATIEVGKTYTIDPTDNASVKNVGTTQNAILEFSIPKGNGEKIRVGKTEVTDSNANVIDNFDGTTHTLDFYLPLGPTGPKGLELIESAYLVTFQDNYPPEGLKVSTMEEIPITRIEISTSDICSLNNNTIKFKKTGHYKISFKVNAYTKIDTTFNPDEDFVSLGFKPKDSDNIYIGASTFTSDNIEKTLIGEGILSVVNLDTEYNIVNLGKKDIYLKTPDLKNISSISYFINSPVTIIIEYLGRTQ